MSTVKFVPVLHCKPTERGKVVTKGNTIGAGMVIPTFPGAVPWTAAQILTETATLVVLNGKADHGSDLDVELANEQSVKVYNMMHDCIPFVAGIAAGVKSVILESGYDANAEPVEKPIPDQPIIEEVRDGKEEHSGKIDMTKCELGAMHIVETRIKNDPASVFAFAMQSTNSHALVLKNLTRGLEIEVRVKDQNSAGVSTPSDPYSFLPR